MQLAPAPEKCFTWPVYLATVRARQRCPACVLVIAPDRSVAAWAGTPVALGPGNDAFRVLVLGPAQIPVVRDLELARASPELAVLSILAHGNDPELGREAMIAALTGLGEFDSKVAEVYIKLPGSS